MSIKPLSTTYETFLLRVSCVYTAHIPFNVNKPLISIEANKAVAAKRIVGKEKRESLN